MNDLEVDILIGCDYYWSEGVVAVNFKLSWLLSGPLKQIENGNQDKDNQMVTDLVTQRNMFVSLATNHGPQEGSSDQIEKFWDFDT